MRHGPVDKWIDLVAAIVFTFVGVMIVVLAIFLIVLGVQGFPDHTITVTTCTGRC